MESKHEEPNLLEVMLQLIGAGANLTLAVLMLWLGYHLFLFFLACSKALNEGVTP